LSLSLCWPGGTRYPNLVAGARAVIDNGRLTLDDPRLRLGRLTLLGVCLRWLSLPILTAVIQNRATDAAGLGRRGAPRHRPPGGRRDL
jgi:hypothetical protein